MTRGPMQKVLQSRLERVTKGGPPPIDSDLAGVFFQAKGTEEVLFIGAMTAPDGRHARVGTVARGEETSMPLDKVALGSLIETLTRIHRSLP